MEPPPSGSIEAKSPDCPPFFQRTDWLSFVVISLLTFSIYLFTLNPSIDLDFSGIYATGAMYLGVPHPPGFPLWTIYGYLFTLLPVSNIAWRVSVGAAFASAMTCGMVALVTSRCSGALLTDLTQSKPLDGNEENLLRVTCGCIAGLALGFDGMFWSQAVRGMPWNFSLMLLMLAIVFFLRWQNAPERTRWLYFGCFVYGLALTSSQAFLAAALGIGCLILFTKPELARDIFASVTFAIALLFLGAHLGVVDIGNLLMLYLMMGSVTLLITIVLIARTRAFLAEWRALIVGALCLMVGLAPYLLITIFSMTNPPMNWGYPRTVDGFWHVLSRGQYERVYPSDSLSGFGNCLLSYVIQTKRDYGALPFCVAVIPFLFVRRFQPRQRHLLFSFLGLYLSLSVFLVYVMNPSLDRASLELDGRFYPASHALISILAGYGMAIIAPILSRSLNFVFRKSAGQSKIARHPGKLLR